MSQPIEITPALLAEWRKLADAANVLSTGDTYATIMIYKSEKLLMDALSPKRVLAMVDLIDELADRLQSMAIQRDCRCGHPACKRCKEDRLTQEVLAKVKGNTE